MSFWEKEGIFYAYPTIITFFWMTFLFQNWFQLTDAEEKLDYEDVEEEEEDELLSGRNQLSLNL